MDSVLPDDLLEHVEILLFSPITEEYQVFLLHREIGYLFKDSFEGSAMGEYVVRIKALQRDRDQSMISCGGREEEWVGCEGDEHNIVCLVGGKQLVDDSFGIVVAVGGDIPGAHRVGEIQCDDDISRFDFTFDRLLIRYWPGQSQNDQCKNKKMECVCQLFGAIVPENRQRDQ